jgi:hypothetical protein
LFDTVTPVLEQNGDASGPPNMICEGICAGTSVEHIGIGRAHKHTRVLVLVADLDVRILTLDGELLRALTLDYQPRRQ